MREKKAYVSNTSTNEKDTVPALQNQKGEKDKAFLRREKVHLPLSSGDIVVSFFSSHFGKLDVACDLQSFHQVQGLNAVSEVTELPPIKQDSYLLVFT